MKKYARWDLFFCATFLVIISLPLMLMGTDTTNTEKRALAPAPNLEKAHKDITKFMHGFKEYADDHFGLRDTLIEAHRRLSFLLFDQPISRRVVFGKDGWLFYTDEDIDADIQRTDRLPENVKPQWAKRITARAAMLSQKHIEYRFVVAPEKSTIYPEMLPEQLPQRDGPSRLDDLMASLPTDASDVFIDLRPSLLTEKEQASGTLYYRTDSHWTGYGGYIGYVALMHSLGRRPIALPRDTFHPSPLAERHDLAKIERLPVDESDIVPDAGKVPCLSTPDASAEGKEREQIRFTTCKSGKGTLLIFQDSFTDAMSPYLSASFARVVYVMKAPTDDMIATMVEKEKPDVVIEERVERGIRGVPVAH